jgi:hypothetical protein
MEFRSEKIPRNRLETVSVIPRKKVLIPRHSEFRGRANFETRTGKEWNGIPQKNKVLRNLHSLSDHSDGIFILLWVILSSLEWFGTEFLEFASIFLPRNGIPSCFLFRWRVRKRIPRVCFYFGSTEPNSELFSLPLKGSEGNSESLLLFLFNGTEFRVAFSSVEGFGTEFRKLSVPRNSRNSVRNNHLFRLTDFREIIFCRKFPPYPPPPPGDIRNILLLCLANYMYKGNEGNMPKVIAMFLE